MLRIFALKTKSDDTSHKNVINRAESRQNSQSLFIIVLASQHVLLTSQAIVHTLVTFIRK